MSRIAFVTGGSGFVGSHLIRRLVAEGWTVRALARSKSSAEAVQKAGAQPVLGDLLDGDALARGVAGCDCVFHVAALFTMWAPWEAFRKANVDATRLLLKIAKDAGVRRFVQIGAAAVVMGDLVPMLGVNEAAPPQERPWAPYGMSKAQAERLVLSANGEKGMTTIVIRPPFIWGAGMPTLQGIVENVNAGRFRWVGGGSQRMSTCHAENVCEAALCAAERGMGGNAYFVSDGADRSLKEVIGGFLATQGIKPSNRVISAKAAWRLASIMEAAWRTLPLGKEPPMTRQMIRLIGQSFTLDISKARNELGYRPVKSWEEGLAEMRKPAQVDAGDARVESV
jgi:nucleoside-diphosphate-sugar epimerase